MKIQPQWVVTSGKLTNKQTKRQYHDYAILDACAVETVSLNGLRLKYIITQNLFDFWTFGSCTAG